MKKNSVCLLLLMIVGIVTFGITPGETANPVTETIIPFELKDYLIIVKCRINDSKEIYRFVLDTGGMMFLDKTLADELKLKQQGPMAKINTFFMADYAVERVFVFTNFDLKQFKKSYGIQVHGIIGSNFLERFTVTLDYKKQQMILSTNSQPLSGIKEKNQAGYLLKFTKNFVNNAPMIACKLNGEIETQAMIDTGQPYSLVLPLDFLDKMGVLKQEETLKAKGTIVKWPGTKAPDNYLTRTKSFEADGLKIKNMTTVYAELPPMLSVPLLGTDFLSQFLITIDYPKSEILLQPITGIRSKDNLFSTALQLEENDQGELVVRGIWEKSPADKAGIQIGDQVLEFNSIKATPETHEQLWLLLRDDKIDHIDLVLKNKKGQRKISLRGIRFVD